MKTSHPCAEINLEITGSSVTAGGIRQPSAADSYTAKLSVNLQDGNGVQSLGSFTMTDSISYSRMRTLISACTELVRGGGHLCVTIQGLPTEDESVGEVSVTMNTYDGSNED